jgi:dihydroorotate dehydrogenase (NAD+) catalytic subunit
MLMIELAPSHKRGLTLSGPVMPATGIMGYGDVYHRLVPLETLGAFVTNPITARARRGAHPPRMLDFPGGLLVHTGLDNPGVRGVIRRHSKRWAHSPVPVIAHVVGTNPHEAAACCERLSGLESLAGVELGLPDYLTVEGALEILTAARTFNTLPLIVKLPLWRASDMAVSIADRGLADALTVAAPPRGTLPAAGQRITGRLYGPAIFPQALWMLQQVQALIEDRLPLIGCGGIHSVADARALLAAGAVAVQVDSYIWRDPAGFVQLAQTLNQPPQEEPSDA